ncbi:mucin-12-like [Arvicola amphibius]|uniref:mucin-12-like n=1 Tax=Arvicola amphibius TaxID=1047088 RepID=UPI001C09CC5E|nr:mucin-12-like [Arvicola amphibius]
MAKPVERGQRASAGPSHSDQRPQFSQPPRPGTPFSGPRPGSPFWVPQWDDDILSQWGKHLPHRPGTSFRGRRPGTPFSVPQGIDDSAPQWETYLTSTKFPRDFSPPGVLRLARHKFRCQKPYEDKTFKIPNTGTADILRNLRALIKTISSKKTLDPLKELKEIKEGQVPLPPGVPDCRSNPLSREPRPSALPPATRKRVASTSVHRPGKVQRRLDMSTVFEEPMDFDHSGTRVSATSPRHCAGDASEKVNEDDTVPGPSSADSSTDRRGLVISPQFQGSLEPSSPTQGALGYSTSSQDAQGLSLSTGESLGGTQSDQGSMGQSISSQASQKPPPFAERKIKHVSFSRRVFKSPPSSRGVTNHSNSPPKSFRQAPSDQGGLHKAPLDKENSKCFSPKGVVSDLSFSQNGMCLTPSPQSSLTPLTSTKDDRRVIPSHEESQACFPSPQNDPKQSVSAEVSLSSASSDQGNFKTSPLNQEGFKCPTPENGLRSSLTAQGGPNPITTPQVSLIPLMPTQAETKLSTSTSYIPDNLPSSEGALESSTYLQESLGTPKSIQGTLVPSQHTQRSLAPASTSLGVLSPSISVKRTPKLSTSREVGQRPIFSHKRKFNPNQDMKMGNGYSHCSKKRRTNPPSEQGGFPVSLSDEKGSKYTLPIKKALLIRHWKENSLRYAKRVQVSHACSTTTQGVKTIQPSLLPQESLEHSTCVREALDISTYTPELPGHLQPVQHFLGSTICDKGTVGKDTSAERVPDSSPSLEMALGCDTCTQEFVANFTLREGDSSDSTCPQTPTGPLHSSQEAVQISPSPQGYQQSLLTTQEAIGHSPSAQRDVSLSTCPQVTPEHPTNTPKVLNSTLSSQGPLDPVLSIQLSLDPNISIQKASLSSTPEESVPKTSTFKQGTPVTFLAAHEDFRLTTYAQETLGDTTPTQALGTSPHSEAVVKKHTCTPDTVAPSPSEQEAQGSIISHDGILPSSSSTQESFMQTPSQEGNIKHVPSAQVYPGHSISTKKRLRDDPSDEWDFGTSSFEEGSFIRLPSSKRVCASSTASKGTSITTSTTQVSPMPSISVQKAPQYSTSEQKSVEPCHSNQGTREHSISSKESQGPSLSVPGGLCHLPSVLGLQGHSPSLSKAPENSSYTQGDLSVSKSDLGVLKPSLSAKESIGEAKCKQKYLEPLPLVQEDLTSPMFSKLSKDPYASYCLLAAEHFPSSPGSPIPLTSKQWYRGTTPSCLGFLEHSPSAPGDLCCFQAAQGAKELLSSAQGPQEKFPSSLSYSGHLHNLPGDQEDSSLEQGILEHVPPAQGSLETSCSPGVSLKRPLLSLERPLDLSILTQGSAGTSKSAQGLQRFLPSTHEYLENPPSALEPLEHLPVAPKAQRLSTLSQETPSPLLPVHGILELPQYGSVALPSMPSVQGLQVSLSPSEGSISPVLSVHGSVGHSLSAQEPIEIYKSTKATTGHSLSSIDDMSPFISSQGTLGPLFSVEVEVETYSHSTGSPEQLKNISGFPGSMIFDHDPVFTFLPVQGTLRHLPSAQEDVGLSLSAQQAPELSTLEQGSIQHVEAAEVALVNPSYSKGATGKFQCAQYALEHLPPNVGVLQHSSTIQGTQESLKFPQESLDILSSNSEHLKNSISATGDLESSLSGSRILGHMLVDKQPEQLSIYAQGSLGNSLSTQEAQDHLSSLIGNLKSCQSAKEGQKTLIPSQIVLESAPSISEDLVALSSALEHMGLSSLANESLENSQYAESVGESSSATGALRTTFAQKSLENSLPGKGIRETLSSSQGALELLSSKKGRVENVSSPERSMKPFTSLQEALRPSSWIQGPHQHPLSAQWPLELPKTDSGIQGPLSTPEAGGNLSREPGSWKSFPLTPETLDHLQSAEGPNDMSISAHEMFDPLPSAQGTLGLLVYSPGLMEPSESERRKLGHVSSMGKDGEISPFEKPAKSASPLTPYLSFNPEDLESSSCGLGSLESLLSAREDAKGTPSAPHAQEPSSSTSQVLEHFVTTEGPLQIKTPNEQTLCPLPSKVEDVEHSTFSLEFPKESQMLQNVLDHLSSRGESKEFSLSAPGTKNISLLAPETLEHYSLQNATQATSPCPQEVVGSLLSEQGSSGRSPSDHGSLGPLASTLGAEGLSLSEADSIQLSASAPVTKAHLSSALGPSASQYNDQMRVGVLPALHGDLEGSQSDQRTVEMTKFAEGDLENLSVAQRTTKLSTHSQEANESSLSDQGHLLHSPCVKEALIPALSDQETEESLLSPSEDTEHPPSSVSVQMQGPSLSTLRLQNISLLDREPLEHSFLQNATQATSPCPQEVVGSLLSEQGSSGRSPSDHGSLGPLASTLGAEGLSLSEADSIQLSASAPVTKAHLSSALGPSASQYNDQMRVGVLPALHGDLEGSQSDQRTVEMTKFAEGDLENLSVAQRTTKLSTHSQEANESSLSDQGHLLHSPCVKEALIPALSDQETEESLLSPSEDTEDPPFLVSAQMQEPSLSTLEPQDSLLTTPKPLKLSISICDSPCPFPSSQESETVELSISSPAFLEPSQSAQWEQGYFSTEGQGKKHSSTASQTTRKLFSPQECGGHLSAPSVQEPFQSGPVHLATLIASQGPQKHFKLTQGLLHPSTSAQEAQELSESSQDLVGTRESSESMHGYVLPEVEPVETFTAVSGTTVTSPSAPHSLELSSLLHVTSATSLTDQKVVGPRPPSQRTLEVLSLAQGTLEPLASARENGRNSQLEKDTVEKSFSVQGILGSLPCTTGVLRSTTYPHKLPEILPYTQKDSLSPKGSLVLPTSANRPPEKLQSDRELTKHSNSFKEASRHSLLVQGPRQESPSATEILRPSFNQGIKKPLLSSPGAMKPSSSAPDANKSLQTTLRNQPTSLSNQQHQENSMSLQGTLGFFSSRPGSVEHSASSPLIVGPPASFQSKLGHLFCTDTSPSFQGPTGPLSFPSGNTGHLQHGTRSHESSLSASKDLAHVLSDDYYISTQGTLASSPYSQQSLQQSASSKEKLGPSKFDQCTHSHLSSVPDDLEMSLFAPVITGTLPQTPVTPGLSSLTQASAVPSPSLKKDDEFCLSSQATLEVNTSGQETLNPSPTTRVPEKASLYTKPSLLKPTRTQSTEGHTASKSGTNQSTQKELGFSPPAQMPLTISLSTQGTLGSYSSDQGALGTSLSVQGSLKLSTPTKRIVETMPSVQSTLTHPTSSQVAPGFSPLSKHPVQDSASSPRTTGLFQSSQKPQGSCLSSLEHKEHLPSAPGVQENPLSNPWTLGPLLSSKVPKELSTATEESLPVLSSLSSIQECSKQSVYSSKVLRQHQYSQNTLGHWSCVREGVETSQTATGTIEALPPPLVPRGHLTSIQGSEESFPSGQGNIDPYKLSQGPLKHVMLSQEMLHSAQFAEGNLQLSAYSKAVPEPYTNSPSTQVTRGTLPSVPGHLGLLSSTQETPPSSCSDETTVGTCPSSQGTLKISKSAQGTLAPSSDFQGTGEFLLSAKGTMGNLTSVKQSVGPFPSTTEPLKSIQNTQTLLGSLQSGQSSLGVSQAAERSVDPSLFSQGSLDLSVSGQGTPVTLLCNQGTRKHPNSSQTTQKTSQSVKTSLQHPPSVPGFLNPSQSEKSTLGSLSSPPGTGISVPGSQEIHQLSASSGYPEPLLYFGLPLELSVCAQGTLCPFSSPQGELYTLHCFSGNLESSKPAQMNLSHLSSVREPLGSSPSVPGPREPSPFNKVPRGLSSHVPGDPASLSSAHLPLELNVSAQCSLSPSASSKGTPGSLLSSADIQGKVQNTESYHGQLSHVRETLETSPSHVGSSVYKRCPQETLGLYSLGQRSQATSQCTQGAVGSCLSPQGSMGLPTSAQRSLGHPPHAQGLSGTSSHIQHACSQSTSAQSTAAYSSSTPVSQGYSQHAKKTVEILKSAPGPPRISITAQASIEPLPTHQESLRYPSSIPGVCKTSTATRGHVVSDDGPLELSVSAQENLSPFHSSQCLLKPSLSVEGTFGLSAPMNDTLGPSVSSLGNLGSWKSSQRVQQTDPSASDSLGSMLSSKGQTVISLSGQGTISSFLEPVEISLSVQVSSRPSLSLQEPGGSCLYPHGKNTLEASTYAHGNLVLSSSSRGDLGSSSSTPVTLGSSPPANVDLGMSPSVSWTLRPPVSAQHVLGTSTSAQKVRKPSLNSQGRTEPLPYAQDDLGLKSLSLGTEGNSQFSKGELKVLPSPQGGFKPALSTPGPVEKMLSASRSQGLFSSTLQDAGSFSLSSQNNSKLSTSSKKHVESSPTAQTYLKHSPSSQESQRPTPSTPGTLEHSLQDKGWQKVSGPTKVTLGQTPHQKGYKGNSLSVQGTVKLSISGQESLGHCSFDQGSPGSSTSSHKVQDPSYSQGSVSQFPSFPGDTHSLSDQGIFQNLSSSQVTLGTTSSLQKDIEGPLDVHGAQKLQPHSPGHLGHSQCTPKSSETLTSPQMVFKCSEYSSVTLETLPPLQGNQGHSISAQSAVFPSDSGQQIQESSSSLQKSVQFFLSSKSSLRPTSPVLGTSPSLSAKLCPELSISAPGFLGSSPPPQRCVGDPLSVQRALGTSISAQEYVGHSKSDLESPEMFTSSQENLGPSLSPEALVHSSSTPQDCGLSQSSKDMSQTSLFTQGARKTPSSLQGSIVTVPSAQSVLGIQTSLEQPLGTSQFASETTEPLPFSEEVYTTLKSLSRAIETLISLLEKLTFSTFAKGDQVILRSPTVSDKALEFSPSDQQSVKTASSQIGPDRTSLTDKGLHEISSGEKVTLGDSPLQQICLGNALSTQGALGLSISAQESLGYLPSAHGSPDTSLSPKEASGTCLDQGHSGKSLSLSNLGDLELSECSQGPLETSPSTHSTLEIPSSTHGIIETSPPAQDSLGHLPPSVQILQQAPLTPETSEPLSSTKEASSPGTSEMFPASPGSLEISFSTQSTIGPSVSEKENLEPSVSLEESLGPSFPDQGSLRPTPLASGTGSLYPSEQGCQEISSGIQGDSLSQQCYTGNSLHSQEVLGLSISAQESLEHSPSAQGSPDDTSLSSLSFQEASGPSLDHVSLGQSSSDPGMLGLSDSDQGTLETPPFIQSILEVPSSNNGVTETSTTSQDSLEHLPPSVQTLQPSLTPETSEPLPTAKDVCKTSESVSDAPKSLPSFLEALRHLNSDQCTLGPSVYNQGNLELSTLPHDTLGNPKPSQGVLESIPSTQKGIGNAFSTEFLGLSTCAHDDFIPIHSHGDCLRYPSYPNKSHRHSHSTKKIVRHAPFPEGDIRYSLSELDALRSFPSAKEHEGCKLRSLSKTGSRHSSSKRDQKPKASPQECKEPSISKGGCRSSLSHEKGGRSSASPQGSHKYFRSIKTKLEQAPSNKADVHASHTEHEGCKHLSLSQRGLSHASSAKRDKKPNTTPQESTEASTSTEEDIGTTPSREETLRHSTSPHGTSSLTSTSTRTRHRHFTYTQDIIKTSTEAQESFRSSPDGDSPRGSVKSSSLPQSNDVRHPVFTKEDFKHTLSKRDRNLPLVPERGAELGFL